MPEKMSQLGVLLQEAVEEREETRTTTILSLLCEQMNGLDGGRIMRSFKQRLGFKRIACCGATWGFGQTTVSVGDDEDVSLPEDITDAAVGATGMNLAAALAAERHFRAAREPEANTTGGDHNEELIGTGDMAPETPLKVSLMRLLEETADGGGGGVGSDTVCCVCMGRKKGAAFIPCGHTFCRVCSREVWVNRGTCPLCNRKILEILDIF